MHHAFIDKYSRLDSPLHRASAGAKLAVALAIVLGVAALPLAVVPFYVALTLLLVGVAVLTTIPPGFLVGRLVMLEPLVAGVAVLAVFQPDGLWVALTIVVKSTLCLATMILLSNTTPFSKLLGVLRSVGMPGLFITVLALMYRYLFVLIDEAERMQRARSSRTFLVERRHRWRSLSRLLGELFVRSSERAERIYAAMCARGWQ